jgi:hypothetical protein
MSVGTTTSAAPRPSSLVVGAYDRLFYCAMAAAMALTVLAGFGPTYYLRFLSGGPTTTISGGLFTTAVHVHGALFTAWVLLFVVQTTLVARRQVAVHRRLGFAGVALAAAMVGVGAYTAIEGAARGSAPPVVDPLAFLAIPLFDIVLFATFVTTAVVLRRDKESHKRLMLLAYVSIIVAAVARLPGVLLWGPPAFFGLAALFIVPGAVYDRVSRGQVHRVYVWGGALFVVSIPVRLLISGTAAWRAFAEFVTR